MRRLVTLFLVISLLGALAAPVAAQSSTTTEELLAGMVTEEVEPGVYRVVIDEVRDLAPDRALLVGDDGSVWLVRSKGFSRLGGDVVAHPPEGIGHDFVTLDGTLWSRLHSYDGRRWIAHPQPPCWWCSFYDLDGTIWAAWMEPERPSWTVAELRGDGWRSLDAPLEPWGTDAEPGGWLERLTSVAGELRAWTWTESAPGAGVMSRWADGEWQDVFRVHEDQPWALGPLAMGSDGTMWFSDDDSLRSFDGDEWNEWSLDELKAVVPLAEASMSGIGVAPDGGLWVWLGETWPEGRSAIRGQDTPECYGVARFHDGRWKRYLDDLCTEPHMGPDGSVWTLAGTGYHPGEGLGNTWDLYVITPEAVTAAE